MGFAHRNPDGIEGTAFIGAECKLDTGGFTCPRCFNTLLYVIAECKLDTGGFAFVSDTLTPSCVSLHDFRSKERTGLVTYLKARSSCLAEL